MSKRNYSKPTVQMIRLDVKAAVLAVCRLSTDLTGLPVCAQIGADCESTG